MNQKENNKTEVNKIVDHLFRHLSGRLVATLTRIFGPAYLDVAENFVQEAFLKACQSWPYKGIPANPSGWLTLVAKNNALDFIRREQKLQKKEAELIHWFETQNDNEFLERSLDKPIITDDQLRLIFLVCHPNLSPKSQVALTLKTVCGFSSAEIARAFLNKEEAVRKLIFRAKSKIIDDGIKFELPKKSEFSLRIDTVTDVLYFIFNEGYSAHQGDLLIRKDFCDEAIRLTALFLQGTLSIESKLPSIKALFALMLLHSSRIPARLDKEGNIILLQDQDRSLWDKTRINLGLKYLQESASGEKLSVYHLEAHIAAAHSVSPSYEESNWERILYYYDKLFRMTQNPVVALNRTIAISMVKGLNEGLHELSFLANEPALKNYYLLPATFAEFYRRLNNKDAALKYYKQAIALVGNKPEKRYLEKRYIECSQKKFNNSCKI